MSMIGEVETVCDGDTVNIQTQNGRKTIRIEHIDAPECGEPYFQEAKQYVIDTCLNETCFVIGEKLDRYGRTIGRLLTVEQRDIGAELVKFGLAWHYKKYSKSGFYDELEKQARANEINLWSKPEYHQHWLERVYKGKQYYYKKGQCFLIPDYHLQIITEVFDEPIVTEEQFQEFEKRTREALIKSGGIPIREIKKLLPY